MEASVWVASWRPVMWMSSFCSVHCSRVATAKAANTRQNLTPCSIMLSKAAAAGSCRILAGALQQLALEGGACCASSCLQTQGTCSRTGALPAAWQTSRGFAAAADPPQEPAGPAPEAAAEPGPRVRPRRPTRAQKGGYADNQDFMDELDRDSIAIEPDIPLYDLQETMEAVGVPLEPELPLLRALEEAGIDAEQAMGLLVSSQPELPPFQGAKQILRWEDKIMITTGPRHLTHPINRKAKMWVYLRELQEQEGLSEEAVQHIARVAGCRYNSNKGLITLTSEAQETREENRVELLQTLRALVEEGRKAFPSTSAEEPLQQSATA